MKRNAGAATPTLFFFFNDTATTEIYTLSLHDALPISRRVATLRLLPMCRMRSTCRRTFLPGSACGTRSEEHTSELQSRLHLVCRLLLEKKKNLNFAHNPPTHLDLPSNRTRHAINARRT